MLDKKEFKRCTISNELIFVLYFWGFTLIRPVLQLFSEHSTKILFAYVMLILIASFWVVIKNRIIVSKAYLIILVMIHVLLFDYLFRFNSYVSVYLYEFITYGVMPIHLLSQVRDPKLLLKVFSIVSFVTFVLYFRDPLAQYTIFGDYMSFGFNLALPAYIGMSIGRKYLGFKWMLVFELMCLAEIIIFANRSSLLALLVFLFIKEIVLIDKKGKKIIKVVGTFFITLIGVLNVPNIIKWLQLIIRSRGYSSYALNQYVHYLHHISLDDLFSGRFYIWENAKNMLSENLVFGHGTGAFQAKHVSYTHNLYYDLLIQYGIIGLVIFCVGCYLSCRKILIHRNIYLKLIGILFFCIWFPKLFFSVYIFRDMGIWCFMAFGFIRFNSTVESKIYERVQRRYLEGKSYQT